MTRFSTRATVFGAALSGALLVVLAAAAAAEDARRALPIDEADNDPLPSPPSAPASSTPS